MIWNAQTQSIQPCNGEMVENIALWGKFQVGNLECRPAYDSLCELVNKYSPERSSDITVYSCETNVRPV